MKFFKTKNKYIFLWALLFGAYGAFIFTFSYLFPLGADEFNATFFGFSDLVYSYQRTFLELTPKIGALIGAIVLFCGRWLFLLLNTLLQPALTLILFYFIKLRLPDFKTLEDLPLAALIMLLSVLAVATPDSTLFWSNGAMNYSWPFLFIMLALCYLRLIYEGRAAGAGILKFAALFILGVICGTSNENNAPLSFLICVLFWLFMNFKKRKMPFGFYSLLFGIACGLAVFFGSPALVNRAVGFRTSVSADIWEKLFWHIAHLDNFLRISFYLPALSVLALAIFAFDKKKRNIKDANYVFAWLCLLACFCAAGVLFLAPEIGWRVYYSATVFSILAFLFTLQYFKAVYGFSLTKYFIWAALAFALVIAPSVTLPYFALHRQDVLRWSTVGRAKNAKRPFVILPIYIIPATPFPNYNIIYYEAIFRPQQERDYFYGIRTYRAHPLPQNERGVSTAVLF